MDYYFDIIEKWLLCHRIDKISKKLSKNQYNRDKKYLNDKNKDSKTKQTKTR